ncbi:hypothetical protein [Halarcobacter anaerophilus]|uniref:hypothetical protein n=1 Tax=Halarcobacter anaerophilus TaxID=877500 RepID=UPI000B1934A0|nr:hypothetical protein [Halarcobacter anaerophilus]
MEALNITQSSSSIYMQLAQKRAELNSVDKKSLRNLLKTLMINSMNQIVNMMRKIIIEL